MSYDAPTPPAGGAPQAGSGTSFNLGALNIFDQIALGAGLLVFILSFFNRYVSVSYSGYGMHFSAGISAWHSYAVIGLLITFVAVILVGLKGLQPSILPAGVPWALVTGIAAGLGWFLLLIRGLTYDGASLGWSGWILIIVGLVLVAATVIPLTGAAGSVEKQLNDKLNRS